MTKGQFKFLLSIFGVVMAVFCLSLTQDFGWDFLYGFKNPILDKPPYEGPVVPGEANTIRHFSWILGRMASGFLSFAAVTTVAAHGSWWMYRKWNQLGEQS